METEIVLERFDLGEALLMTYIENKTEHKEVEPDMPTIDFDYSSLPSFLKGLIDLISPTTLAPDEFIVTALLSSMSSAIGTRVYIQFSRRVFYPSIWNMIIAPSSDSFKSTAIREARNFILKIDKEYEADYVEKFECYKQELKKYELLLKKDRIHTTEPIPPIRQEIDFSDDETFESFYQTLHDNTDGGLLAFDEIGGWIEGFDKYRNGNSEKGDGLQSLTITLLNIKEKRIRPILILINLLYP